MRNDKFNILSLIFLLTGLLTQAQIFNPVSWSTKVEQVSQNEYDLVIKAKIEPNWHLYSQNAPKDGAIATRFTFEKGDTYETIDRINETEGITAEDKSELPKQVQSESKFRPGKKLCYIGQKWSEFQALKYKANTKPFYVLEDHDEKN